jgi:hypothetical protein
MDLNEFLSSLFGEQQTQSPQQAAQEAYRDLKDLIQPSWHEVGQRQKAVSMFLDLGVNVGQHVSTCVDPTCSFKHGPGVFCDVDIFLASIKFHCDRFSRIDREANDLFNLWIGRDREAIRNDPRYIGFRVSFDKVMLLGSVLRECLQDPFKNAGIRVD